MSHKEQILKLAKKYESHIIDCRRKVHTYAEVGGTEFKTKALILEEVNKLGLPYEELPTNSLIIKLDTGRPGKVVALRADIDALPLVEHCENLKGPRTCISEQGNTQHACGHDAHTSMLLGAMHILNDMKDTFDGTVLFCFEEGEELGLGWEACLEALKKYNVDSCFATHVYSALEENKVAVDKGPCMAGATGLDITFKGKSGHGSRPDLSINPVFCAANFLNNLTVAFANQIDANETVTMGITTFHAGDAINIFPETARITGTYRFFNGEEGKKAKAITSKVAKSTADMHGCTVNLADTFFDKLETPVVNDGACAEIAKKAFNDILPEGSVVSCPPWYASESYANWLKVYPGVLAFLGIKNLEEGFGAEHHNIKFDLNEAILKTGAITASAYAIEFLGQ